MMKQEIGFREENLQKLLPLLAQKSSEDVENIMGVIAELERNGKIKKERTGNLDMWLEDEEKWAKLYFVLQNRCLYYYKTSKAPPKGIITLQFTVIEQAHDAPENSPFCIHLRTPLSNFILRAKHEVAMEEWIAAMELSKSGPKKKEFTKVDSDEKGLMHRGDDYIELNQLTDLCMSDEAPNAGYHKKVVPELTYRTEDGRQKTIKLALGTTTIGRSDSCGITLEDKQVSRSHAKIEVTEATAVLSDLGSGHGTKVNHEPVTGRVILQNGDSISMGKTKLKFVVEKKK